MIFHIPHYLHLAPEQVQEQFLLDGYLENRVTARGSEIYAKNKLKIADSKGLEQKSQSEASASCIDQGKRKFGW
jgi:hypothetical protein